MCQHCCRMAWTTCEPIPYACPLCPVRQVSDRCDSPGRGDGRRHRYGRRHQKAVTHAESQICRGISELYDHVVAAKHNAKTPKRKARNPKEVRLQPKVKFQLDEKNIPVLYRETSIDASRWTWSPRDFVADSSETLTTKSRSRPLPTTRSHVSPYV